MRKLDTDLVAVKQSALLWALRQTRSQAGRVALFAMFALSGCRRVPQLVDYPETRDLKLLHPSRGLPPAIFAVGTVGPNSVVAGPIPSHWNPAQPLLLQRVKINIENVLRGDLPKGDVEVYYFTFASSYNGPRLLGMWETGQRFLFAMRRDSGVVRMACDGVGSCARPVESGKHPDLNLALPLEDLLADVFFTRGSGVSEAAFADSLIKADANYDFVSFNEFGRTDPKPEIKRLLLLADGSSAAAIRTSSCEVLALEFSMKCAAAK